MAVRGVSFTLIGNPAAHTHSICRASPQTYPAPAACWSPSSQLRGRSHLSPEFPRLYRRVKLPLKHIRPDRDGPQAKRSLSVSEVARVSWSCPTTQRHWQDEYTLESYLLDILVGPQKTSETRIKEFFWLESRSNRGVGEGPQVRSELRIGLVSLRRPGNSPSRVRSSLSTRQARTRSDLQLRLPHTKLSSIDLACASQPPPRLEALFLLFQLAPRRATSNAQVNLHPATPIASGMDGT